MSSESKSGTNGGKLRLTLAPGRAQGENKRSNFTNGNVETKSWGGI